MGSRASELHANVTNLHQSHRKNMYWEAAGQVGRATALLGTTEGSDTKTQGVRLPTLNIPPNLTVTFTNVFLFG